MKLINVTSCSTTICNKLDEQLIGVFKRLAPAELVCYSGDKIKPTSDSVHLYFQASALRALLSAIAEAGEFMTVSSCYRTIAQQYLLYNHYRNKRCNVKLAAYPGKSNHQNGLSIDIPYYNFWKPYLVNYGWRWAGLKDPYHFYYVGSDDVKDIRSFMVKSFQILWNEWNDEKLSVDGVLGFKTFKCLSESPVEGWSDSFSDKSSIVHVPFPKKLCNNLRSLMFSTFSRRFCTEILFDSYEKFDFELIVKFDQDNVAVKLNDGTVVFETKLK